MKKKITIIFILSIVLILATFIVSMFSKEKGILEKTSLRLKWINQAQFSGFYTAKEEGYYSQVGLDVRIDPAGPNISSIQSVVSGANEFGIAGADQILAAIDNNIPIVALAVIYRETPESLVFLKEKGINKPSDLEGKTVGIIYGNDETLYRLFLQNAGVDATKIKEVAAITGTSQILTSQVDAKMAYEMNDYILLKLDGKDVDILRFRDYGVKFYADTIFTTKELIEKEPEKVKAFVEASLKGWKEALSDTKKAIDLVIKTNPTLDYNHQLGYLNGSLPLITTDEDIGFSKVDVWQNMIDILYKNGIIKNKLEANKVFTNEFIK